jgi:hypothetical protein
MSENPVPQEEGAKVLDFTGVTVIGLGGGGINSINGDTTPAQILSSTNAQLNIFDIGGGLHTLTVNALLSINGDLTPAQTLSCPDFSITIADPGAGAHTFLVRAIFQVQSTGLVPVSLIDGVETVLLSDIVNLGNPGLYEVFCSIQNDGVLPGGGPVQARARIYNGAAVIGEDIRTVTDGPNVLGYGCSIFSYLVAMGGGETIQTRVLVDTGGAGNVSVFATMNLIRIGA